MTEQEANQAWATFDALDALLPQINKQLTALEGRIERAEPMIKPGDRISFIQPWREDELPRQNGSGIVKAIHTSPRRFRYYEVEGRERWVPSDRIVKVERVEEQKREVAA